MLKTPAANDFSRPNWEDWVLSYLAVIWKSMGNQLQEMG